MVPIKFQPVLFPDDTFGLRALSQVSGVALLKLSSYVSCLSAWTPRDFGGTAWHTAGFLPGHSRTQLWAQLKCTGH